MHQNLVRRSSSSRRGFLDKTTAAAFALGIAPQVVHPSVLSLGGKTSPNNRIAAGFIGTGDHGVKTIRLKSVKSLAAAITSFINALDPEVVAIISRLHSEASTSKHPDGKRLQDFTDLVLDTGAPVGDAMVKIPGLDTPVAPGSTVGGCLLVNTIKAEVAARFTKAGQPPKVLSGAAVVGQKRAVEFFESAYYEHARRLSKHHMNIGLEKTGGAK